MSFSLRTLLLIVAALSVVAASLVFPETLVGDLFYTMGLLTRASGGGGDLFPQYATCVLGGLSGSVCHVFWA